MIGFLLVAIAIVLAVETKSLLLGESATKDDVAKIRARHRVRRRPRSSTCKTLHLGPEELLVAAKISVGDVRHGARRSRRRSTAPRPASARPCRSPGSSTSSPTCSASALCKGRFCATTV